MGKATIVSSFGEGLYEITLDYDAAPLNYELSQLAERQTEYFAEVNRAFDSLDLLRQEKNEARFGMDEVIQQWLDALIDKLNEEPPPIDPADPNDPETGEPWVDPDRAQDAPLFAAINAARTGAGVATLTRNSNLDIAILRHLKNLQSVNGGGHIGRDGSKPAQRAAWAGYLYSVDVGVGELLAPGSRTAAAAVERWQRTSVERAILEGENYTECGVGFVNAPASLYGYLWGAIFAYPGTPPPDIVIEEDPAQDAAEEVDAELERIPVPTVADFSPQKLADVAGRFARAAQKVRVAEEQVARLRIEYQDRARRIQELEALREQYAQGIFAWACMFEELEIEAGSTVKTAEVPGFWRADPIPRITTMGVRNDPNNTIPNVAVSYFEQPINLVPDWRIADPGILRSGTVMSDAAVFVNAAMEPGHLRWKPLWRYGTITGKAGNTCALILDDTALRGEDAAAFILDETLALADVPISYPPCDGEIFEVGDAVLVLFEGQDRDAPKVIGFRREPRPCPSGRISWSQLS